MKEKGHQAPKDLVLKKETSDPKDRQSSRRRGVRSVKVIADVVAGLNAFFSSMSNASTADT